MASIYGVQVARIGREPINNFHRTDSILHRAYKWIGPQSVNYHAYI